MREFTLADGSQSDENNINQNSLASFGKNGRINEISSIVDINDIEK